MNNTTYVGRNWEGLEHGKTFKRERSRKMKGYKGFKEDEKGLYCEPSNKRKYYPVGKVVEQEGKLLMCEKGIHFCKEIQDVQKYYSLLNNTIAEIEVLGDVITKDDKSATNKIKVVRVLSKTEVLEMCNTGENNSGLFNSGYWNSGDYNSGDRNSGDRNSGDYNSVDYNSGSRNSGYYNSGDRNSGYYNSGLFNTDEQKARIFNMQTDMTMTELRGTKQYRALFSSKFNLTEWIKYTKDEMEKDETKKSIGGCLKEYTYKEACANWWANMTDENKALVQELPNFNAEIFEEITGIKLKGEGK